MKTLKNPVKIGYMTTKEVSALTGIAGRTVIKYAEKIGVTYYGEGRRKVYDWKKTEIEKLKKMWKGKVGRPKKDK